VMASTAWLVGGILKLLTEKEKVVPELREEVSKLVTVTVAVPELPLHCMALLRFYIKTQVLKNGANMTWKCL